MKYLMIFYYYIIDKKIFCEKRVFYEKIGKMMSNIGYRSPFLPEWHSCKEQVRLCLYTPHLFSPRTTRTRAPVFPRVTRAPPVFHRTKQTPRQKTAVSIMLTAVFYLFYRQCCRVFSLRSDTDYFL